MCVWKKGQSSTASSVVRSLRVQFYKWHLIVPECAVLSSVRRGGGGLARERVAEDLLQFEAILDPDLDSEVLSNFDKNTAAWLEIQRFTCLPL